MATEFQKAAAAQFPDYTITGDGAYALICPVSDSITLFSWWMEAACALMQDHSNWRCKNQHSLTELKPLPQRMPARRGIADKVERE